MAFATTYTGVKTNRRCRKRITIFDVLVHVLVRNLRPLADSCSIWNSPRNIVHAGPCIPLGHMATRSALSVKCPGNEDLRAFAKHRNVRPRACHRAHRGVRGVGGAREGGGRGDGGGREGRREGLGFTILFIPHFAHASCSNRRIHIRPQTWRTLLQSLAGGVLATIRI